MNLVITLKTVFFCADRVVDEMQPKNLFTRKQQDTLLLFSDEEAPNIKPEAAEGYDDELLQRLIRHHHDIITKVTLIVVGL